MAHPVAGLPTGRVMESADPGTRTSRTVAILAIACIGWFLFGWQIAQRGLWSSHEGRAAQNAQVILDDGDWLIPHLFTGQIEDQKPPLYYWMVSALGWMNHGHVNALGVRLPAALAGIAGLVLVYLAASRQGGVEAGIWATTILACSTRYAWLSRVGRIDMPLCLVVTAALLLVWRTLARNDWDPNKRSAERLTLWTYALLGVGVLLKGPVAAVLFALPVASYLFMAKIPFLPGIHEGWRGTWRTFRPLAGAAVCLGIAGPWFVYASIETDGEFFRQFFLYHNIERAVGTSEALKAGPFWFYIPRMLVDFFPWSLLLPAFYVDLWQQRSRWWPAAHERDSRWPFEPSVLFLLCWSLSQFAFLSLVSFKRADYLLPVFPPMALLFAAWLRQRTARQSREWAIARRKSPERRRRWIFISSAILVSLAAPLLVWACLEFRQKGVVDVLLSFDLLREHLNETDRFMMHNIEHLIQDAWPMLFILAGVMTGGVWLIHTGWYEGHYRRLVLGLGLPWLVGFLLHVHVLLPALDPLREMSRFAASIRAVAGPDATIHFFGKFDSDLAFHVGRPAHSLDSWEELARLSNSPAPAFVVIKASQLPWVREDVRLKDWSPVLDNTTLAFGGHRDHRLLMVSKPTELTNRLDDPPARR